MSNPISSFPKTYPHRRNWDKSYDSICPRCYRTIANRRDEMELAEEERGHVCEMWRLEMLRIRERPVHARTQ